MTKNYNDGKWHGWNGGAMPVHPKTRVQGLEPGGVNWMADAEDCHWESLKGAFRVTKPYAEPREFWIVNGCEAYDSLQEAQDACSKLMWPSIVHVREVTE